MELKITCVCPDLSSFVSPDWSAFLSRFRESDILVMPEYLLELAPLPEKFPKNQLVVWGSRVENGANVGHVSRDGEILSYKKQRLTPWESHLEAGEQVLVFEYKGCRVALLICFDVEFPELSLALKSEKIDVLLVPAATEGLLGYERVSRCASARAVELGCAVVTCHLIGRSENEMIDVNVGNHHLFLPSQTLFPEDRFPSLECFEEGEVVRDFIVNVDALREQRMNTEETNPAMNSVP